MSDPSPPTSNNKNKKLQKFLHRFFALFFGRIISSSKPKDKKVSSRPLEKRSEEMKVDELAAMKRAVKEMNFGGWEEKESAAVEITRLAKADVRTRRLLAELGVIPSLVSMLVESKVDRRRRLAVEALVEMASGNFTNKKLMVEAGLLSKLPQLMHSQEFLRDHQFMLLLFSISSLAKSQFTVASRHILPLLVEILNSDKTSDEVKLTCIATLYNLSTKLDNIKPIVTSGAVHALLTSSTNKMASEGALATLGNLVPSSIGKSGIEDDPMVPKVFIEILAWDDKSRCQELAAYLLMVIAHGSTIQRQIMAGLGIVPVLLEVALLGSSLARKRALKLLQWFKDERQMRMRVHSGPQGSIALLCSPIGKGEMEESRRAVKNMVKQSLDKNMELIMRRANGLEGSSGLKALVASSSSKSLPY